MSLALAECGFVTQSLLASVVLLVVEHKGIETCDLVFLLIEVAVVEFRVALLIVERVIILLIMK